MKKTTLRPAQLGFRTRTQLQVGECHDECWKQCEEMHPFDDELDRMGRSLCYSSCNDQCGGLPPGSDLFMTVCQ